MWAGSFFKPACFFFLLLHMFRRHVGVQKRLFSKLPAAMHESDSGLSPLSLSHCTQQHNLAAAGAKLPMALFKNIKMSWRTGKQTFRKTAVSNLINCSHEKIIICSFCDKQWVMMHECFWGWVRVKGAIQKKWLPKKKKIPERDHPRLKHLVLTPKTALSQNQPCVFWKIRLFAFLQRVGGLVSLSCPDCNSTLSLE